MSARSCFTFIIFATIVGNLLIVVIKFVAAFFTGCSAMLSDGLYLLVNTNNEGLLIYFTLRTA